MATNFNMRMREANCTLSYVHNQHTYTAKVRVSQASYTYGVTSTESHSRTHRAFYPHRRALGEFTITVDAIHYAEFRQFMNWLRGYVDALFVGQMSNRKNATIMEVRLPSRAFHKYGILTTGIDDHDQTGSMVFSPQLHFQTLKDFNDNITIKNTSQVSEFHGPTNKAEDTTAFYPATVSRYKDTDSNLYDAPGGNSPTDKGQLRRHPLPVHIGKGGIGGGVGVE